MKNWFEFKNAAADTADVYIFEEIGFWGITAKDFIDEWKNISAMKVNLHINSVGGSIIEGMAIHNIILNSGKEVTAYVDGAALSIASVIALAADKVIIFDNASFMIHNPASFAGGESDELRQIADVLDKMKNQIANIYVAKSGKSLTEINRLMDNETWYNGAEAVAEGFADESSPALEAVAVYSIDKFGYNKLEKYEQYKNKLTEFHNNNNQNSTEEKMNAEELKAKHPDLYNQVHKDALDQGRLEGEAEGRTLGAADAATNERKRLEGINSLRGTLGADKIIDAALKEPTATKESVSVSILEAQQAATAKLQADNDADNTELLNQAAAAGAEDTAGAGTEGDADAAEKKNMTDRMAAGFNKKSGTSK